MGETGPWFEASRPTRVAASHMEVAPRPLESVGPPVEAWLILAAGALPFAAHNERDPLRDLTVAPV